MAGRYSQNYGSNGGSNNNGSSNDYDDNASLSMSESTAIEGILDGLGQFTHDRFGTSLIVNVNDVEALDGILMEKTSDSDKLKIISWEEFGFSRDEDGVVDVEEDEIPSRYTVSAGGKTHAYELIDAAVEGAEGTLGEPVFVGDVAMFMGGTSKGRTLTDLVTQLGEDARNSDDDELWNDDFGWLKDDVADLREDLEGRKVELFFKPITYTTTVTENGEEVEKERSYAQAVLIDSKTGETINTPDEQTEGDSSGGSVGGEAGGDNSTAEVAEPGADDLPEDVERVRDLFIDKAQSGDEPSEEDVEQMLTAQVGEADEEHVQTIVSEAQQAGA